MIFVMDATIGQACESQVNNLPVVYLLFFDLLEVLVKMHMHFDSTFIMVTGMLLSMNV